MENNLALTPFGGYPTGGYPTSTQELVCQTPQSVALTNLSTVLAISEDRTQRDAIRTIQMYQGTLIESSNALQIQMEENGQLQIDKGVLENRIRELEKTLRQKEETFGRQENSLHSALRSIQATLQKREAEIAVYKKAFAEMRQKKVVYEAQNPNFSYLRFNAAQDDFINTCKAHIAAVENIDALIKKMPN
jgi:hypothetical protein